MSLTAAILGANGYGGSGLVRRLRRHPEIGAIRYGSRTLAGQPLHAAWPNLAGLEDGVGDVRFLAPEEAIEGADVVFLATPHGATAPWVRMARAAGARVIDLSADSRLDAATYSTWYGEHPHPEDLEHARYGLVEGHRHELPGAGIVAAPGCNATAVSLALLPFAVEGLLSDQDTPVCTVIAAASGAGRTPAPGLHYPELAENARPYKAAGTHRHLAEIEATLGRARSQGRNLRSQGAFDAYPVSFTPHLVAGIRGILATCTFRPARSTNATELHDVLQDFYRTDSVTHVQNELPDMKAVANTDRVLLASRLDERSGLATVFSVIDNLGKGAAGQAVQGFNVAFGFTETTALEMEAPWP